MLEKFIPELGSEACAPLRSQLEQMIAARRIPHALVIEGEDAGLNRQLALLAAQAKLCSCSQPLSGECEICRTLGEGGKHPDVVEVLGSGKTGVISVDTVRQLHTYGSVQPERADGIVYLMENGDLMLKPAQNAFLKLFEEPPAGITFIITCTASSKLLETIRSRAVIVRALWPQAQEEKSEEWALAAEQTALSLLAANEADTMRCLSRYSRSGKDGAAARRALTAMIGELREILRQALIINAGAAGVLRKTSDAAEQLARSLPAVKIEQIMSELPGFEQAVRNNASLALVTSAMCVRLRKAAGK